MEVKRKHQEEDDKREEDGQKRLKTEEEEDPSESSSSEDDFCMDCKMCHTSIYAERKLIYCAKCKDTVWCRKCVKDLSSVDLTRWATPVRTLGKSNILYCMDCVTRLMEADQEAPVAKGK